MKYKKVAFVSMIFMSGIFVILSGNMAHMRISTSDHRYTINQTDELPQKDIGIVFGAGILPSGEPSQFLADRLDASVALYDSKKIIKIIVSGNSEPNYSEPDSMYRYLISKGVKDIDILKDGSGRGTYETCKNVSVSNLGRSGAVLVTHSYHLSRAITTCQGVGLDVIGVGVDWAEPYTGNRFRYNLREVFSSAKARFEIYITKPSGVKIETNAYEL